VPERPVTLSGAAAEEWDRITSLLARLGLVQEVDRAALAIYCQAWARWLEAEAALRRDGCVIESPNGYPIQSPWLAIAAQAVKQMHAAVAEFGLSPVARARIRVNEQIADEADREFFGE
jgi:P27 family predicted phage terminase small subunit